MEKINIFGSFLEDCVKFKKVSDAKKCITDIKEILSSKIGNNQLDFYISKIFDDSFDLLKFLRCIADRKEWGRVLAESLNLLHHIIEYFFDKVTSYVMTIMDVCQRVATSNCVAYEKGKAIDILFIMLNKNFEFPIEEISKIYVKFLRFTSIELTVTKTTVQKNVFLLLGVITKKYPAVVNNQKQLIDAYLCHLKQQSRMALKDRDKFLISGCIEGLSNILQSLQIDDPASLQSLYTTIKSILTESKTFDARGIVLFISKHCSLLIEMMYDDSPQWWHQTLYTWVVADGQNYKAGYAALEIFYVAMAELLKTKTEEKDHQIYQYFYNYFLTKMKDDDRKIVRLAIRGFGTFSAPCTIHMNKQNLSEMFILIINKMEQDYFVQETPELEQFEYLPDYIHCFSTILYEMGEYTFDQINSLQQMSVLMVKVFPRLSPIYHYAVFDSMTLMMCQLLQHDVKSLQIFLQRVVYQSVLWTCSHRTTFDVDVDESVDTRKVITYKSYLELWKYILTFSKRQKLNHLPMDVKEQVIRYFYDELITTLLLLINKLNLNTKIIDADDMPLVDLTISCEAEKIDDYIIFINCVDFYVDLLTFADPQLFRNWIKMYINQVILQSNQNPYVSGFYKLFTVAFKICDRLNYFDNLEEEDIRGTYQIVLDYLENILQRVQEYKDDLQVACLYLLLAIPIPFVPTLLPQMPAVFQMVFTVGRGYLKLADIAIDTLNTWYTSLSIEQLIPLFRIILPSLDPYLRSKGYAGDPDIKETMLQRRETKTSRKRKVYIENESELSMLQEKILMFVGQLKAEVCQFMIESKRIESTTWDRQPYLKFTLPYRDVKPSIYLDKLIPRVIELALSSADLKTRITACELLHAIVIFMLGTGRQMYGTKSKELSVLFTKIIQPILQLGCDSHDIVRQLFNPLVFQLVHWYSSPMQYNTNETDILIDTLMENISHPTDTAIRDLSGKCIREFVMWTIKQSRREDLEKKSDNIKLIVQKLNLYCLHPNLYKRRGAALAFNYLYRYLREEESMIDAYWFELLYSMLMNMSQGESKAQITQALWHLERVLREKNLLFNRFSTRRQIPVAFNGPLLENAVEFLLEQTGSLDTTYRRECIKLFCNLAPYVNNYGTTNKFFENKTSNWWLIMYESDGIGKTPTLQSFNGIGDVTTLIKWLRYLLRCLDAYTFLFEYRIIGEEFSKSETKLNISLQYFIEFISTSKLNATLKLFPVHNTETTPQDSDNFTKEKCLIIQKLLEFLPIALEKCTIWCETFYTDNFWNFLCTCLFQPNNFGFDLTSKHYLELPQRTRTLLDILAKKTPDCHLNQLTATISMFFINNYDADITNQVPYHQRQALKTLLILRTSNLYHKLNHTASYFVDTIKTVFNSLISDQETAITLSNTAQEYSELLLKLSFDFNNQLTNLIECLLNKNEIKLNHQIITHGEYFLTVFNKTIMEYICLHLPTVIRTLSQSWTSFSDTTPLLIIIKILKYAAEHKWTMCLTEYVMSWCEHVFTQSPTQLNERNVQIEFMAHVIKLNDANNIGNKYPYLKKWFLQQFAYKPNEMAAQHLFQFKTNVLCFLHCVTGPDQDTDLELQSALTINNTEIFHIPRNQLDNTDITVLFKKLLDHLVQSKSTIVLKCAIDVFTLIKYDENNINIYGALQKYITVLTIDQQLNAIKNIFSCSNNTKYTPMNRYKIAKVFLSITLQVCEQEVFEQFFIDTIKDILGKFASKLQENENDLADRCIRLILIEGLFARINITRFLDKTCPISQAAFETLITGKELLIECTKIVKSIRKDLIRSNYVDLNELHRLYHCHGFNTLISIFTNTKKSPDDVNTYSYLLHEDSKSNESIWANIIDCTKLIQVPQDFDSLPTRRKIFVNIRDSRKSRVEHKFKYIESQNLFNSTLSEDICKFDFTNTLIRNTDVKEFNQHNDNLREITFETVDMNNHECMATICGLCRHLVDNGISPLPETVNSNELPRWMLVLRKKLDDSTTEINVKLFLARVIHNEMNIFKYYSQYFFEPISKFIQTFSCINYFVADLVEMLVQWSEHLVLPDLKQTITDLVEFLIIKVHNDRRDMLKYNLEIIKTTIEVWASVIHVPSDVIYNKLQNTSEQLEGIHLISILLVNNLIPWTSSNFNQFINALFRIITKERLKTNYKPVAEVFGIILQYLSNDSHYNTLMQRLVIEINKFEGEKLFYCIEQIQIHHPVIIDKFLKEQYFKMFCTKDLTIKYLCLKNILRRFEHLDIHENFTEFLESDNRDIRLIALQLINKSVKDLSAMYLKQVVTAVCAYKLDQNNMIRCAVYDVLITVYKQCSFAPQLVENQDLLKICRSVLLAAQLDSDLDLQQKIQKFWCAEEHKEMKLTDRFIKSLTDLYSPDTELYYIGYSIYFLLEICKKMPEYTKLMFEHPLSDCHFDEYKLLINRRTHHSSMAPLFSSVTTSAHHQQFAALRASVSTKVFTPTPSPLDHISASTQPTSSFYLPIAQPSNRITDSTQATDGNMHQHSRRFLRNRQKISLQYSKYEVEKKKIEDEMKKTSVKRKDASVVVYRNYRKGELPDVQIPYSSIIEPLQILARRDSILARQLYVMLFNGLIAELNDPTEFITNFNRGIISIFDQTSMYVPNVIGSFLDILLENNTTRNIQRIQIDVDTLTTVCKNSGLLPIGCLLMEDYIYSYDTTTGSSAKRGCAVVNERVNHWVKLADMYKELNEWDAVIGIFSSNHMECPTEDIQKAIHAEANGQFKDARSHYANLIRTDTNFNRKDFYYESFFKCYTNLSEWDTLSERVHNVCEDALWDGDWNQEKMLPWYMLSQVSLALEGSKSKNYRIINDLDSWMKDRNKADYLKDRFSSELAILALVQNDPNAARHYIQNSFSQFLDNWSHLNPMFPKIRAEKLLNFQRIVDLKKYLTTEQPHNLVGYWQKNSDLTCPSVIVTEINTLYREQLLNSLETTLIKQDVNQLQEQRMFLNEHKLLLDLNLIGKSLECDNYAIAKKYCIKNKKYIKSDNSSIESMKLTLSIGKIGISVANLFHGEDKLVKLIKACSQFSVSTPGLIDLQVEFASEIFKVIQKICNIIKTNPGLVGKCSNDFYNLTSRSIAHYSDLQEYGTDKLLETIRSAEIKLKSSTNPKIIRALTNAYMSYVIFAQTQDDTFYPNILRFVLRSMALGSKEARQLFPCLLQNTQLLEDNSELFKDECSSVPTWMFLSWFPQLLVSINSNSSVVKDLLIQIATEYPQAVMYTYRLSRDNSNLKLVELDTLLTNDLIEKFLFEFSCVCIPESYINYYLERLIKQITDHDFLQKSFLSLKSDFVKKLESSKHFKSVENCMNQIENLINTCFDVNELKQSFSKMYIENSEVSKNVYRSQNYRKLEHCSSWLANFRALNLNAEIEVPGQYTGDCKPLVKYHAKIFNFHVNIAILTSLRKPIKLTMLGTDSKEYPFLIKFGEDLRQDQRIQQLFSLTNDILAHDTQCSQRYLRLEQYQVIPLSTCSGLIRWVNDTKSLYDLMYGAAENKHNVQKVREDYYKWITAASTAPSNDAGFYAKACTTYTKNITVPMFTKFVNVVPPNILSKAFWSMSADAESYTCLRQQFITSYATMCIVHWLFGIGDRNLHNCLILQNTGHAVGIDFGYAFGTATQNLPIPELIPFRLSPHILSLMEPLRESGFIEQTMIHCIRALRKHKHILTSTMDVFVKEPSVDWLDYAKFQGEELSADSSPIDWYPDQRVTLARRKLNGVNPRVVTVEELETSCVLENRAAYISVARGDQYNIRSQLPDDGLTEEQQVQCLLDQAMDYNILGRMYHGLELWL